MSSPASDRPQSTGPSNNPGRNAGQRSGPRILLWVVIVLTLALMVWMSVFTARHNPYLSDVGRNKISRSKFIEACKTKFDEFAATVGKSQNATFNTAYDPISLVSGAVANPQTPGWVLSSNVTVSRAGLGSQAVPFACQSDGNGVISLVQGAQGSQQGQGQPQQP